MEEKITQGVPSEGSILIKTKNVDNGGVVVSLKSTIDSSDATAILGGVFAELIGISADDLFDAVIPKMKKADKREGISDEDIIKKVVDGILGDLKECAKA